MDPRSALRQIPAVERVLQDPQVQAAVEGGELPRSTVVASVRQVLEEVRRRILAGETSCASLSDLADESVRRAREQTAPRLVRVVNATGVVIHTNLGRAPLAPEAVAALERASGYCNLEYNLAEGRRGSRHDLLEGVLCELTGAEAALAVNNNAAAVLLGLSVLARGLEVVVSRGELVEIGGAFRVPEVMAQSGAVLREVGTTNKTHLRDYEQAIGPDTALLLKVHTSNYRILGFTASVSLAELVELGRRHGVAVMEDLGGGCLVDLSRFGIEREPTVQEAVASGADLVTFSGDKLLGGPQVGILLGRKEAVEACARHPLMRALRPDKLTLAALEATLALYRDLERAALRVPVLEMLSAGATDLRGKADDLAGAIREALGDRVRVGVREDVSEAGGGSLPLQQIPTWVVEVGLPGAGVSRIEEALRGYCPPVVARIHQDALVFDPRTLREGDARWVVEALEWAFAREGKT